MKNIIIITVFFLVFIKIGFVTPISGDISGVLSSENSPYEVVGDLHVPQGLSLEIEAGCYFDFQGYYHLEVDTNAVLRIQGSQSDSVIFTTQDTIICWEGINFLYGNDGSELNHCIIEWAQDPKNPENPGDDPEIFYGAVFIKNLKINISNCLIRFNKIYPASDYITAGGGIYCNNSTLTLTDCIIAKNLSYEGSGGGIYADSSVITINNCKILNNRASFSGSGIVCEYSISILTGNIISGNETHYGLGGEDSGAIFILGGETLIEDNKIVDNLSGESGGGIRLFDHVSATLNNNYIADNIAYTVAGGLNVGLCPNLILTNNIIANNQTYYNVAGGIAIWRCENMIFSNNTIYGNSGTRGGGVAINNDSSTTFINNIFYNNFANEGQQLYSVNSNLIVQYSCIEGGWPGEGNIDLDPLFVDPDNGDFHLSWDNYPIDDETKSPCIDAGAPWSPHDPDSTSADMGALYFDQWLNDIVEQDHLPRHIRLHQNYPNPFNARTQISYALPRAGQVSVDIYDMLGRKVQTLYNGEQAAGEHSLIWQADGFASGVYFYKLTAGDQELSSQMMLIK